jgi:drug/metabolite transporter (DMT)-like permease
MTDTTIPPFQGRADRATNGLGILLFVTAMVLFVTGDSFLKIALRTYPIAQILMFKFWAFVAFALVLAGLRGSLAKVFRTRRPLLQIGRGATLVADHFIFAISLGLLGLSAVHAIYATMPLIATALAVPVLGEKVGWRRWSAVGVGFAGALLIIRPGGDVLALASLVALLGAASFAVYGIATKLASRSESFETNLLFAALVGAVVTTPLGAAVWVPPDATGWALIVTLTATSLIAHLCVIRAYTITPATILQPFNYTLIALATTIGMLVFDEQPALLSIVGALIVVASGLYVAWREAIRGRPPAVAPEV